MGMAAEKLPPKAPDEGETEETVQFNFRIPKRLLAALDAWLDDMNRGRRLGKVTRAEVLRAVLERDVVERPMLDRVDGVDAPVKAVLHHADGREIVTQTAELQGAERTRWFYQDIRGSLHGTAYRGVLVRQDFVVDPLFLGDDPDRELARESQAIADKIGLHAVMAEKVAKFDKDAAFKEMNRIQREQDRLMKETFPHLFPKKPPKKQPPDPAGKP